MSKGESWRPVDQTDDDTGMESDDAEASPSLRLCLRAGVGYFVLEPRPTANAFVLATCVSNFFGSFCLCSYFANILDIAGPQSVSAILGISNSIAALPGVLANVLAGLWLDGSGQWQQLFAVSVLMQTIGLAVYLCWARGDPLFP